MIGDGDKEVRRRLDVVSGIPEYNREEVGVKAVPYDDRVFTVAPLTSLEWLPGPCLAFPLAPGATGSVFTDKSGGRSFFPKLAVVGLGFSPGDFARLALSTNQCLIAPS